MNFIKASKEVFAEYGVDVSADRQLSVQYSDGHYIKHFENSHSMMVQSHMDSRVTLYTEDAMRAYLEFVEGDGSQE